MRFSLSIARLARNRWRMVQDSNLRNLSVSAP
jgi:hypothetical protein